MATQKVTAATDPKLATKLIEDAINSVDQVVTTSEDEIQLPPDTTVELPGACPDCGEEQIFNVDLDKDVEIKQLDNDERYFSVDCKIGEVRVGLPDGGTQKEMINSANKTSAELDTILLKSCISTINGLPLMNPQQVRELSVNDRRKILTAISDRNPGPQLNKIKKNCQACGQEVPLPLTLADLF